MPQAKRGGSAAKPPTKAAAKPRATKAPTGAAKPAAAKTAASRSTAAKPATARATASRATAAKTSAAKTSAAKTSAAKPAATKSKRSAKAASGPAKVARDATAAADARVEAAAQRLRKLNERIIEAGKDAGESTLANYEKALKAIAGSLERGPGSSDIEWISNLATAQAKFIRDVTSSWTKTARDLLK
jgi:ABC-2 type transport system ATP-binding protein